MFYVKRAKGTSLDTLASNIKVLSCYTMKNVYYWDCVEFRGAYKAYKINNIGREI